MMEQNRHSLPAGLLRRLASLALAVSLALGLAGCEDALAALQDAAAAPSSSTAQPVQPAAEGAFSVNFIDVGQALSVLVTCDGRVCCTTAAMWRTAAWWCPICRARGSAGWNTSFAATPTRTMWGAWRRCWPSSRRGTSTPRWPRPIHSAFRTSSSMPSSRAWRWRCPPWAPAGSWAAPPCRSSGRWPSMTTPTTPPWWCGSTTARPASC